MAIFLIKPNLEGNRGTAWSYSNVAFQQIWNISYEVGVSDPTKIIGVEVEAETAEAAIDLISKDARKFCPNYSASQIGKPFLRAELKSIIAGACKCACGYTNPYAVPNAPGGKYNCFNCRSYKSMYE